MGRLCMVLAVLFPASSSSAANPSASLEQAVKASFLFKFAPFVEWPTSAFTVADRNFVICVAGQDPFGGVLDDVVRAQKMAGRPITVRRPAPGTGALANPAACHILFAGQSAEADYAPFASLSGQPVLTVSDKSGGPSGAMIQFVMQGGRVRFQIDDAAARASGLRISSKLLGLAFSVDRK